MHSMCQHIKYLYHDVYERATKENNQSVHTNPIHTSQPAGSMEDRPLSTVLNLILIIHVHADRREKEIGNRAPSWYIHAYFPCFRFPAV